MHDPYSSLKQYSQFIIWKLVSNGGKQIKLPCDPMGDVADAHNPSNHMDYATATALVLSYGAPFGIGFVFREDDPFWVVDIDGAYSDAGWSPLALELIAALPGALVEVSQSGRGLHIIGTGVMPPHAKKNTQLHIECYSEARFLALGKQEGAYGNSGSDLSAYLPTLVDKYFPPRLGGSEPTEWSTEPTPEWNGYSTDEELITKMLAVRSVGAVFGGALTPAELWVGDVTALSKAFPSESGDDYDRSSADASLAQRLAFYTGKNCDRIERIMQMSGLVRDKWEMRPDYLQNTILRACSMQIEVFAFPIIDLAVVTKYDAAPLKGTPAQVAFAEQIRAEMMASCTNDVVGKQLCAVTDPSIWLDNRGVALEVLSQQLLPAPIRMEVSSQVQYVDGVRYVDREGQVELFEGCIYLADRNEIFSPWTKPNILPRDSFNVKFGGREFQMAFTTGELKPSKNAFDAFTQTRLLVWPHAEGTCFKPAEPYGTLINDKVNMYDPSGILRIKGDATHFLRHLAQLLPIERDRTILLSYMAACVQYKGTKFQWAPLIQGVEGNGKTLLSMCVREAVGAKYCHSPKAAEISNKFNHWLENKVFIYIEDIFVAEHKSEVFEALKPMITGSLGVDIEKKGKDQHSADICCNFMFNSNHKNAIRKTENDRRFAVFYTAQQQAVDIVRDGMDLPDLWDWLFGRGKYEALGEMNGFGIVSDYLHTYAIPPEFNPARGCHRAPITSSTAEALKSSMGGVEQEIVEAIEEGRFGFSGGWVGSHALDELLTKFRAEKAIPPNKRRDLLVALGYDYHPSLKDGRVNNPLPSAGGKKPRLYVRDGHPALMVQNGAEVARMYEEAQNWAIASSAFGSPK